MLIPISYVQAGMGLMSMAISIPLILRKIPMNRWYGIRIAKAFVSDQHWHAINSYGGKWFFVFGLFLLAFSIFGADYAPDPRDILAPVFLMIPLLAIVPVIIFIQRFAKQLPDSNGSL